MHRSLIKLNSLNILLLMCCALLNSASAQTSGQQPTLTAEQYLQEGNNYANERQYDKAIDSFRLAIKVNANLAAAYYGLGNAYANMGRMPDALEPMRTAVRLAPDNANAHLALGRVLAQLRRFDEGLAEMNEAKRLAPDNANIYNEIGNLLLNGFGRLDEAMTAYVEARRLNPNLAYVHHNIGLLFIKRGRFAEAIAPFEEALRLDPHYRNARYFLADAYTKTGNYDKAIDSWTKFLELVPNGPDALTNRSWTYLYQGGHGREAAADARKFLEVHGWKQPTSPYLAIMANLGYREAGMNEEAQAILEETTNKIKSEAWPFDIVRYLKEEISSEELLQLAADNDKRTEAHAYTGMDLLLKGKREEAQTQFEWVREYGNKLFFEYRLALEELKRLK
jgi:tetratricopeptide (TPR) repeat protein